MWLYFKISSKRLKNSNFVRKYSGKCIFEANFEVMKNILVAALQIRNFTRLKVIIWRIISWQSIFWIFFLKTLQGPVTSTSNLRPQPRNWGRQEATLLDKQTSIQVVEVTKFQSSSSSGLRALVDWNFVGQYLPPLVQNRVKETSWQSGNIRPFGKIAATKNVCLINIQRMLTHN